MKIVSICALLWLLLSNTPLTLAVPPEEPDLLTSLRTADLKKIQLKNASIFQDASTKMMTITFHYTQGEPEVRIPVEQIGWPTDWSSFKAVQYTFHATSLETIAIGFSNGQQTKYFITEPLAGVRIKGVIPFDAFVQTRTMTPLLPKGYKVWPQRLFTFEKVEEIVFKMRYPSQPTQLTLYNFTLTKDVPRDDILDKRPLIDRYGQWIPENWEQKAHTDEQLRSLWAEDHLEPAEYPFCPLGGDATRSADPAGFFRTAKIEGKWVFIDPHGHPFYSAGMDLVGYNQSSFATDISGREYLFEALPPPGPAWLTSQKVVSFYISNIMRRFGGGWQEKWTKHTLERLKNWGFNTIANWSDRNLAVNSRMPYVLPLSGWTTKRTFPFPYDFPDVFSKEFEQNVDAAAEN